MNAQKLFAAAFATIALGAGSVAFAQEATVEPAPMAKSSLTRAEVTAEFFKARANGELITVSEGYTPALVSQLPREVVKAQTQAAVRSGEVAAINAEVYHFVPQAVVMMAGHIR